MKFHDKVKGKIIISIDKIGENLNSDIQLKGLANNVEITLTSLLVNFASFALRNGKDPSKIVDNNLKEIIKMIEKGEAKKQKP